MSNTEQLRTQLVIAYRQKLSVLQQKIVQMFSVIYEPVSRAAFLSCFSQLKIRDSQNKPLTPQTLKPHIDALIGTGVLVQNSGEGPQCHPLLVEIATRDLVAASEFETFVKAINEAIPLPKRWHDETHYFNNQRQLIREVRIGIYRKDLAYAQKQIDIYQKYNYSKEKIYLAEICLKIFNNPFDRDWFQTLPEPLYETGLTSILEDSLRNLTPADRAFELLQETCMQQPSLPLKRLLIEQLIWRGQYEAAQEQLDALPESDHSATDDLQGWLFFLEGADDEAIAHYAHALQVLQKSAGKRKLYFTSVSGLFFVLALLGRGEPTDLIEATKYGAIARQAKNWLSPTYRTLESVLQIQQGNVSQRATIVNTPIVAHEISNSLEALIGCLCLYWIDAKIAKRHLHRLLEPLYEQALAAQYGWISTEAVDLLTRLKPQNPYADRVNLRPENICPLAELIQPQEAWELSLTALANLKQDKKEAVAKPETNLRLAWFVTFLTTGCLLQPREQSNAKGEWSKGRPIALKRLKNDPGEFSYLTSQDLQVCSQIKTYAYGWNNKTEYTFREKAIADLIGHPLVFWEDNPTTRIEVVKGEPELLVQSKNNQLMLQFSPKLKSGKDILVVKESPTRLKVIEVTTEHHRIADILGEKNQLVVPVAAKERVLAAINAVSGIVTVHSDIGGGVASAEVPADPKPHVHLLPAGEGLKVAVLARPFAGDGPYYRPGSGGATVIAEIDGKRLQTTRDLLEEKRLANAAIAACPPLVQYDQYEGEWLIDNPEDCLELLLALQDLNNAVIIEWPEGEKLRVNYRANLKDFKLTIKRQNDWFATEGELKLDNRQILGMQQLMELLEQTPSRFIPLGNGQFLALTQEFRKRLDELRAFSDRSGQGLRLHPLSALAIEDWIDEVGSLKADKHWKAHIQKLQEVKNLDPKLPSTLQADLRDYQIEGFRWLARLAHWGVGACLADDMGLGKTLQAITVILTRAPEGPSLIVAPTSVCMNWLSEAQRFAPTLNPIQFGSGDRQKMLDNLQPFDLLVCSYGLLQQENVAEMLAKCEWQTIVLDEAQSIKNFATKRSQAAMNLQGKFKLITTGTPIENHLGELWNLFRFINPGLLGSLESFNQRFAVPIERYQDKQAKQQLKKLIQPFLLRRTKNQVLEELPSRTEITLQVDLSPEELAFYEALRRDAIVKLAESDATAGTKHLQVLAEIMRLRRACCNSRLVRPEVTLPSAKLQLFGEVLAELLENHHKALVFSQFVDHLHILRDYLDRQQIQYQYLDGSTPAPDRKKRVNAFQAGEGDVFLISLKAGGTGLNLTAADYVIHMDPWWNPAVEDQASDRAHRIGQQRPVTIYRLVAKHTIEEKIVQLHQHKRDLADSLLEGTEVSGKISTEDLLRLIQEG